MTDVLREHMGQNIITVVELLWLDKYGMVLPQKGDSSGNGLLYSSMFIIFCDLLGRVPDNKADWFVDKVNKCSIQPGNLTRTPDNSQKQESWDDYLGVIVACIVLGNKKIPRQIIWHGITHAFFFKTQSPLTFDAFLGRFLFLWPMCLAAAFPIIKDLMMPFIYFFGCFMTPNANNAGALQTNWIYFYGAKKLGFHFARYDVLSGMLPAALNAYYALGHPFFIFCPTRF